MKKTVGNPLQPLVPMPTDLLKLSRPIPHTSLFHRASAIRSIKSPTIDFPDMPLHIVLIEDELDYARLLGYAFKRLGHPVAQIFHTGEDALAHTADHADLIMLDVLLPGRSGLEILKTLRKRHPEIPIVMVSSQTSVETALLALEHGAFDYLTKGYDDLKKLPTLVKRIVERNALLEEAVSLREPQPPMAMAEVVGTSEVMQKVYRLVRKTYKSDLAVALIGESGTGKEVIAHAIHQRSNRRLAPFIVVNCAAIPSNLMESTFFGHERGAFTGAFNKKIGSFEQAHCGTLFLDEIGDLNLDLQAKLLRVLQNGTFQRIGGSDMLHTDVRILCATNKDITTMVQAGTFREDLYYRLFQFPIALPPLRERGHDVLLLANHFREAFLERNPAVSQRAFSMPAKQLLLTFGWPGNVRQLKNVVERALLLAEARDIQPTDLLLDQEQALRSQMIDRLKQNPPVPTVPRAPHSPLTAIRSAQTPDMIVPWETIKRMTVAHAYHLSGRHMQRTASHLGVTRSTISRLLKQYDLLDK